MDFLNGIFEALAQGTEVAESLSELGGERERGHGEDSRLVSYERVLTAKNRPLGINDR